MSRVLRSLEKEGLIEVTASRSDGRVRVAKLTRAGRAERAELDRASDRRACDILEPLTLVQRQRLVAAMNDVEWLLTASMITIAVEDPASPDARWCIAQYVADLNQRFDAGWDPSRSISADPQELVPPHGLMLVGRLRGKPVGCGALKFHPAAPTELKRMWVAPESRGIGLGRRLLLELENHARESGSEIVRLETNRSLTEAIALYRSSGYREVEPFNDEPYAHYWFEKTL
jgi:GNAT superfamily N-acetyltransferase